MRYMRFVSAMVAGIVITGPLSAQTPASDPSVRLQQVLPAHVAEQVLATIAAARARALPAAALEQRALKFAAKGVAPEAIARSVSAHADRMERAKAALEAARGRRPAGEEVEGAAEVLSNGDFGAHVSQFARSAENDRPLAVAFFVLDALMDAGMPVDEAFARVSEKLEQGVGDADLERMPAHAAERRAAGRANRPANAGRPATGPGARPIGVPPGPPENVPVGPPATVPAGPPAGVPANPGAGARPTPPAGPPSGVPRP
jgi:hypothetical protein